MSERRNHISSRCIWLSHFLLRRAKVHVSFLVTSFYCDDSQNILFNPSDFHCITPTLSLPIFMDLWISYGSLESPCILFSLWETCVHFNVWWCTRNCVYVYRPSYGCICKHKHTVTRKQKEKTVQKFFNDNVELFDIYSLNNLSHIDQRQKRQIFVLSNVQSMESISRCVCSWIINTLFLSSDGLGKNILSYIKIWLNVIL